MTRKRNRPLAVGGVPATAAFLSALLALIFGGCTQPEAPQAPAPAKKVAGKVSAEPSGPEARKGAPAAQPQKKARKEPSSGPPQRPKPPQGPPPAAKPKGANAPVATPAPAKVKPKKRILKPVPEEDLSSYTAQVSLESARQLLGLVQVNFRPPKEGDPFVAAAIQRRRARLAQEQLQSLRLTDPADEAERKAMLEDLRQRFKPILVSYLRALYESFPPVFRGLSKADIAEFKRRVPICISEGEYFLRAYPSAAERAEVQFYLAKFLFVNSDVYFFRLREQYRKEHGTRPPGDLSRSWRDKYFLRIAELLAEAEKDSRFPARLKPALLRLRADTLINSGKGTEGARRYIEFIRRYPEAKEVKSAMAYVTTGQHLLYGQKAEEAYAILKEGVSKGDSQKYFPNLLNWYYKSLKATGRLKEAISLWEEWGPEFNRRGEDPGLEADRRNAYRLYGEWHLFRLGYMHFALGEYDKAAPLFQEHLDTYREKKGLNPATQVYLTRSARLLSVIENLIGKEVPELGLENLWAFNKPFSVLENRGKVIAICFRSYNSRREHPALRYLQKQYERYGEEAGPLAVVAVAYLKGKSDVAGQLLAVEKEMKQLGLTYWGGLDPTPNKEIFRSYDANVGSATLVFVDTEGRMAYYEQDPMPNAFGLFRRVLERLIGQ